jgi:hypothetical protein
MPGSSPALAGRACEIDSFTPVCHGIFAAAVLVGPHVEESCGPVTLEHHLLRLAHRVDDARKLHQHAVAGGLDDAPSVLGDFRIGGTRDGAL